jgi:hypothetical protein
LWHAWHRTTFFNHWSSIPRVGLSGVKAVSNGPRGRWTDERMLTPPNECTMP